MATVPGRCPACNRFIGPLEECPYCDCPAERQAGLRLLRLAALALALGGLVLLALAVRRQEAPLLSADAIRPSMNFARVRMRGLVAGSPRSGATRNGERWYGFTLDDGTGRIRVSAFGELANELAARTTESGMAVRVTGLLTVKANQLPSIQVHEAAALQWGDEP